MEDYASTARNVGTPHVLSESEECDNGGLLTQTMQTLLTNLFNSMNLLGIYFITNKEFFTF